MKLTTPQIEVLKVLAKSDSAPTTTVTVNDYVSGVVVAALHRRGLVTLGSFYPTRATITDEGRAALKEVQP